MKPVKSTKPIPGSIVTAVVSVTSQLKVALSPSVIVVTSAEKEMIIGSVIVTPPQPDKNVNRKIIRRNFK